MLPCSLIARDQQVANATLILNRVVPVASLFQFAAQIADVSIYAAVIGQKPPTKRSLAESFFTDNFTRYFEQELQDFEFSAGQCQYIAVDRCNACSNVKVDATKR